MTENMGPLSGYRVVDFTWAAMGPYAGYLLAAMGAEVIQVSRPLKNSSSTTAAITQFFDVGKTCVKINVKDDQGKALLIDLISKSNIFLENFRPGVVESLGLDFMTLTKTNPDLVMVSGSALGRGGPDSSYVGYAPIFSALSGLADLTGFEDGRPTEIRYPSDLTSGAAMAFSALAGLADNRGGGTYIDLAARDALTWTLSSSFATNSAERSARLGNGHERFFPHGLYKCEGNDQWIAIAIADEKQRNSLYGLIKWMGGIDKNEPDPTGDEKQKLDECIETWTSARAPREAVSELQALGIPCSQSADARDIWEDDHLRAREFFKYVDGLGWVAAPPWRTKASENHIYPSNDMVSARSRVFHEILKMTPESIEYLIERGVIG